MYIKIKHLKYFFLIFTCVFFAGFNYLTYVKAADSKSASVDSDNDGLTDAEEKLYKTNPNKADTDGDGYSDGVEVKSGYDPTKPAPGDKLSSLASETSSSLATTSNTTDTSLTDDLTTELKAFIESKGDEPISNKEINDFIAAKLADNQGEPLTLDDLPAVDKSKIKVLDQTYASMSAEDKKKQIKADGEKYFMQIAYLLMSSSPKSILSEEDFTAAYTEFETKLNSFSESNTDQAYFLDIANRAELLIPQLMNVEVPQTFVDSHIKIIRIAMGFLSIKDNIASVDKDPVLKLTLLAKIQALTPMLTDFLQTDFANYAQNL